MNELLIHNPSLTDVTIIQNAFIDEYMTAANGEYVKLYLYLLRLTSGEKAISFSSIAEALEHTEKDIKRALTYWEKQKLLTLSSDENGTLTSIEFIKISPSSSKEQGESFVISKETAAAKESIREAPKKLPLTQDRIAALKNQDDIEQLLFIAAQYLGKTLSSTEISNILYFYDTLHFSTDLIEYLIEYCVSKGSKSSRYIEKVALEWEKEGITTIAEAKKSTNLYNKKYYAILNVFGIKGRGPAPVEIECMERWLNEYHFTLSIITEACNRTIAQTQRPNFQYANKILSEWHKNNIRQLSDIQILDEKHLKNKKTNVSNNKPAATNKFNNFHQREYDFEELEKKLLNS